MKTLAVEIFIFFNQFGSVIQKGVIIVDVSNVNSWIPNRIRT